MVPFLFHFTDDEHHSRGGKKIRVNYLSLIEMGRQPILDAGNLFFFEKLKNRNGCHYRDAISRCCANPARKI